MPTVKLLNLDFQQGLRLLLFTVFYTLRVLDRNFSIIPTTLVQTLPHLPQLLSLHHCAGDLWGITAAKSFLTRVWYIPGYMGRIMDQKMSCYPEIQSREATVGNDVK